MNYEPIEAAIVAYRSSRPDEAVAAADRAIGLNPFAAEAHLIKLLLAIRRRDVANVVESLRACLASRPAEWVVERLRLDFKAHGAPPLTRDIAFKLGAVLRSSLGVLGPAVPSNARRANHEFINVVGSSYVRSFGGHPAFFPLFIGMGPTMLLLTEHQAAITRRKFAENLKRVDPNRHTLLIAGSDPYYYVVNLQKTGTSRNNATEDDLTAMDAVAERHRAILSDAKSLMTAQTIFLGLTPTFDDHMNELCRHLNGRLRVICQEVGVVFLDWWDELMDPATGHLREDYSSKAYPGDIHFSLSCTHRFMELLKEDGFYSADVQPGSDFQWSHVFEANVEVSEKTRIWCEPSVTPRNAFQSHKVAASHLGGQVADLMTTICALRPDQTLAMVNVRDGYLPASVPPQMAVGCRAFTDTVQNQQVAQQVLDFYGRLDVLLSGPESLPSLEGCSFTVLALLLHPDSFEADEERCNEALARLAASPTVLIATPFPARLGNLKLGDRAARPINISNRHIPEAWREYSVALIGA